MVKAILLSTLLFLALAQEPQGPTIIPGVPDPQNPSQAQGAPEPDPYPEGMVCSPKGTVVMGVQTGDAPCACQAMCVTDTDEEGRQSMRMSEDSQCKQFCRKDKCACPHPDCCQ